MDMGVSSPEVKRPGFKVTTHLHLVPRLNINGVVPTYILPECLRAVHGDNINEITTRLFIVT
jgi:hypothetical protein